MKILITGAAGFIGFHLTQVLLKQGCEIIGLDSINNYYDTNLKFDRLKTLGINRKEIVEGQLITSTQYQNYQFIKLNIEDQAGLENLFRIQKFDKVCNLAAQAGVRYSLENPRTYINTNIIGYFNIIENCKTFKVRHLIYASSSSVYGNSTNIPFRADDKVDNPISIYAATKKTNELIAYTYSHLYGLETTGLRFFTVYGPWGRPDMAYFSFTKNILNGVPIKIFNHGDMSRDFTYIDDIIEGIRKIVMDEKTAKAKVGTTGLPPYALYNIGNSRPIRLLDFIDTLEQKLGVEAKKIMMPMQPGDVSTTYADAQALIDDYDYAPNTSLDFGIGKFVNWYTNYMGTGLKTALNTKAKLSYKNS